MGAPKTSFKFSLFGIFRRREREFIDGWKEQISFRFNTFIFIQMYGYKKGKVNVEQILQKHLDSDRMLVAAVMGRDTGGPGREK